MRTPRTAILLLTATVLALGGCRKAIEDLQTRALIDIITSGRWVIEQFTESSTEYAQEYAGYEFKFSEAGTVDAYLGGSVTTGTFVVDALNARITSRFPAGSAPLLIRLNETWSVTKASISQVEARPTDASRNAFLRIRSK